MTAPTILCVGGANTDTTARTAHPPKPGTSNPVSLTQQPGGVALNTAVSLAALGCRVTLLSCLGNDAGGAYLRGFLKGIDRLKVVDIPKNTPGGSYYSVIEPGGDLFMAFSDMAGINALSAADIPDAESLITRHDGLYLDTNLNAALIGDLLTLANRCHVPVYLDPVSSAKALRLQTLTGQLRALFPNQSEYTGLFGSAAPGAYSGPACDYIVIKNGSNPVRLIAAGKTAVSFAVDALPAVNVNGAGDAFNAGFIAADLRGHSPETGCREGIAAAAKVLQSDANFLR